MNFFSESDVKISFMKRRARHKAMKNDKYEDEINCVMLFSR
jgi:hypothetical protein